LRWTRLIAISAAAFSAFFGVVGMSGWIVDSTALKTGFIGDVVMKTNAALGLCSLGIAAACLHRRERPTWQTILGRTAAALASIIGGLTLLQHITGFDLGIDQLLFDEPPNQRATTSPNRMGPPASTSLTLLGIGWFNLERRTARNISPSQWLAIAVGAITLLSVIGYATGAPQLYGVARFSGIAASTAAALFMAAIALLLARPKASPAAILVVDDAGGHIARRMVPASILLPIAVGWLLTRGQRLGFYDVSFARALMLLVLILLFTAIVSQVALRLSNVAAARRKAEEALILARGNAERLAAERSQLLESERAARADAERAARMKDEFLAIVSHELRTPLNAILGWATIAKQSEKLPTELARPMEVIQRNARLQAQLIQDLLDVSAIINGKVRLEIAIVDIAQVLSAAIAAIAPSAQAKTLELKSQLEEGLFVEGDPKRLQQLFGNVLANAVKFTQASGFIEITTRRVHGCVEITVKDSGIGIRPEFLPNVFDRFRQADGGTTRRHGGLGLGLAIVKSLAQLHDGNVRVESPGEAQGTTFIVELPCVEEPSDRQEPAARSRSSSSIELHGVRVLVVDDAPDARDVVGRILEECGMQVTLAESAEAALQVIDRERIDVLISDISMPDQDGYELIRKVRERFPADTLPAIALTAFARAEDAKRALDAGFQLHRTKPVEPQLLESSVIRLMRDAARAKQSSALL
jgi:signal transduction histidine kinase/ActR/RegA family two-component response regulator